MMKFKTFTKTQLDNGWFMALFLNTFAVHLRNDGRVPRKKHDSRRLPRRWETSGKLWRILRQTAAGAAAAAAVVRRRQVWRAVPGWRRGPVSTPGETDPSTLTVTSQIICHILHCTLCFLWIKIPWTCQSLYFLWLAGSIRIQRKHKWHKALWPMTRSLQL